MYTINVCGLTFTGSFIDIVQKYRTLSHYMGGEDGWAYAIQCFDVDGTRMDMEHIVEGMRRLMAPA